MIIRKIVIENNEESVTESSLDKYISIHGYHFTDELADAIGLSLEDPTRFKHTWNCSSIDLNSIPKDLTVGDVAFFANYLYSKFFPTVLIGGKDCIKVAIEMLSKEYPEFAFDHFLTDLKHKDIEVDWEEFI